MHPRLLFPSLLLLVLPSCSGPARPTEPGLVLQLEFEDDCAPVAIADLATQIPASGVSFVPGLDGRAAHFDGSGAELKLKGLEQLGLSNSMTLEFYVNAADWQNPYAAGGGLESLVSHSDNFTVAIDPTSHELQACLRTSAREEAWALAGGTLTPGAWHHVALVLDGAQELAHLVLDGDEVATLELSGALVVQANLELVVGTWFKQNQAFCGELDSIRLWKRALSADELAARAARVTAAG